jgi:rare lipoprotein A
MGTELIVSYGGKSVPVTVTDRGPYTGDRELDLSQGAAEALGFIRPGVDYVEVTCANGGIYPNCTPGSTSPQSPDYSTTPQDGLVVEEIPLDPTAQDGTTVQDGIAAQDGTAVQDGGTTILYGTAVQDGTVAQDGSAVQDGTTVQDGTGGGVHVVQPGETLAAIAAQLGTSADHLITYNGITDPNVIYAGQALFY